MLDKIGYKFFWTLLTAYAVSLFIYLFAVVNVFSHNSFIAIILFSIINVSIDYFALICAYKFKKNLGTLVVADILVFTLFYTLLHFFTVIYAKNILTVWQYSAFQSFFLILYILSVVPRIFINKSK